jgi:hypothetical protein
LVLLAGMCAVAVAALYSLTDSLLLIVLGSLGAGRGRVVMNLGDRKIMG